MSEAVLKSQTPIADHSGKNYRSLFVSLGTHERSHIELSDRIEVDCRLDHRILLTEAFLEIDLE